jgi:osmoprotectant transport system substrate-binding protein
MKRLAVLLSVAVLVLSGCGNPLKGGGEGGNTGTITIGSSDVPENLLVAQLYAGALRKAGVYNVEIRPPVGGREVVVKALQDKSLSLTPDYSGNLLRYFEKNNEATRSDQVYADLGKALPRQFELLDQAPAQDKDVLVASKKLGLTSMSQLGPRCKDLVFGGPGQWSDRWKAKIKQLYGCEFKEITTTDTGGPVTVAALKSGDAQVVDMFSTDSRIESNGFVQLADPKSMFPAQNIVPIAARGTLTSAQKAILNKLSAALTTEKLAKLDDEYTVNKRDPADISDDFLRANGLA